VTLTSKTPDASFRYTLDGTVRAGRGATSAAASSRPAGAIMKVIAYTSGMADSAVAEMPSSK
jgi:hypothetical protein